MRMKKDRMLLGILFLIGSMALGCGIFAKEYRENNAKREDINSREEQLQVVSGQKVLKNQEEISKQVLRFHIRAASDKEEDQQLKLKVKNQIVNYLQSLLADCESKESCEERIEQNLDFIEKLSSLTCRKEGRTVKVHAYLTRESFPLKQYGDIVLPSGIYDALRVDLGEGEGKNWWCMMYPSLCMVDGVIEEVPLESKEELRKNLSEEAYESLFWSREEESSFSKKAFDSDNVKLHVKWKLGEKLLEIMQ